MSQSQLQQSGAAFFVDRFDIDQSSLETTLGIALERQVDHADLFFEYTTQDSVALEEGIVKSGGIHLNQGVGVRVQSGERQGYAHSDEITRDSLRLAANTARAISASNASNTVQALAQNHRPKQNLYPLDRSPTDVAISEKVNLLDSIDRYARASDSRIQQVMASVISEERHTMVVASDGTYVGDTQPFSAAQRASDRRGRFTTRGRLPRHGGTLRLSPTLGR